MEQVSQFMDSLLEEKGITDLDDETREALKRDMIDRLMAQIDTALINALPEDKLNEFNDRVNDPDFSSDDATQFFVDAGLDVQKIALQTMIEFRMLYIGGEEVNSVENAPAEDMSAAQMGGPNA
jgi:hypothetical protein